MLKKEIENYKVLMRNVPAVTFSLFVISIIVMNLIANKSISLPFDWLALNCGIIVSWLLFLANDVLTRRFGPKAATEIAVTALVVDLFITLLFILTAKIAGPWAASFVPEGGEYINQGLNATFAGAWYVVFGSSVAFVVSALVNNFLNHGIDKFIKDKKSFKNYAIRSYASTMVGQLVDNLIFSFMVSHIFFGWSTLQCITCSISVAIMELLFEVFFSPIGFKVVNNWEKTGVGQEYLDHIANQTA